VAILTGPDGAGEESHSISASDAESDFSLTTSGHNVTFQRLSNIDVQRRGILVS
jgi:hypothetical protein